MLTITHSPAEGTLVLDTAKGDGAGTILKQYRFRWSSRLDTWYLPHSRDRSPQMAVLKSLTADLRAAEFDAELIISSEKRTTEQIENDRAVRAEARADALNYRAERQAQAAEAHNARADHYFAKLGPMGQSILVDHHSGPAMLNAQRKGHAAMAKYFTAERQAQHTTQRADAAARQTTRRYSPHTVARRIDRLEADERKTRRALEGHTRVLFRDSYGVAHTEVTPPATDDRRDRLLEQLDELQNQIHYWTSIRTDQVEAGLVTTFTPETISKGDQVLYSGQWLVVWRVNKKSVSVKTQSGLRRGTVPFHEIHEHRPTPVDEG